jgi:hypothetical protein
MALPRPDRGINRAIALNIVLLLMARDGPLKAGHDVGGGWVDLLGGW